MAEGWNVAPTKPQRRMPRFRGSPGPSRAIAWERNGLAFAGGRTFTTLHLSDGPGASPGPWDYNFEPHMAMVADFLLFFKVSYTPYKIKSFHSDYEYLLFTSGNVNFGPSIIINDNYVEGNEKNKTPEIILRPAQIVWDRA